MLHSLVRLTPTMERFSPTLAQQSHVARRDCGLAISQFCYQRNASTFSFIHWSNVIGFRPIARRTPSVTQASRPSRMPR
jgi:hypothetical protein